MASRMQLEKLIFDVNECVAELIKEFSIYKVPINDDNVALHRFEEKLEFVLQHTMKEKLNILGSKKSFWDYISATFTSLKRSHEGLKYVRSMSELKTSLGRGRALIRFCLMHKCLADTLQTCFTDDKMTNEYYYETSIPVQEKHSTALIESLYELNELNFDLIPRHADLDISWPTFARKVFLSENLSPPSRSDSVTSFNTQNNMEAAPFFECHDSCLGDQKMTQQEDRKDSTSCINSKIKVDELISENYSEMEKIERNTCNSEEFDCQTAKVKIEQLKYEKYQLLKNVADLEQQLTLKYSNSLQTLDKKNMGEEFPLNSNLLMHKLEKTVVEKHQQCIEIFIMEQDKLFINLESKIERTLNENNVLQSKICVLRDLLHSYGLLKTSKDLSTFNPAIDLPILSTDTDSFNENELFDLNLKSLVNTEMESIVNMLKSTFSKFKCLGITVDKLHSGIKSSQALNDNLLSRVQDQELHLKGITKELKEAQVLVSVMKQQHQKLRSAEGILKYDLQEKRKLMTKLKQQLESTREDWNRVRQKNSKSEAEWQDLRKEFVLRQKQASEESGFVDDKECENKNVTNKHKASTVVVENSIINCSELPITEKTIDTNEIPQEKTRLENLEERCQNLYSSLLKNSSKRQELDNRLNTICKGIEQSSNVISEQSASDSLTLTDIDAGFPILFEECIVKDDLNGDCPTESSSSNGIQTSEIGSLNSNCSNSPLVLDTETNSFDDDCSYDTTNIPICLPCAVSTNDEKEEQTNKIVNKTLNMENNVSPSFSEFTNGLDTLSNYENFQQDLVSNLVAFQSSSLEAFSNEEANDCHNNDSLTQVDSLLIKKKDLENSLEQLNIHNNCNYINDSIRKYKQEKKEFLNEIFVLKNEKEMLQKEVVDLKNKLQMVEIQLDQLSKQLDLSRATKEQEVVALQFQLNTEALKYQRALKQFSEDDKGLKDMKQKINDQESLICALEDALTEIRTEKEYEKEHRWQELEEIQFALMAREEDILVLTHDLETLKEVNARNQRDKESIEAELLQLHGDSKDLKRKLVKLLKEKDILWKRADYLSHLQRVKIDDRWVADHEVSNCLGCHKRFSLVLRRHHCRICGRIFCHTCSNNWLLTTASRKKSRVCHECYKQHLEIKQEARRGSDVPCLDEGSDDEEIDKLCTHLRSSGSFSPGYPDSLGNSFISLQVTAVGSHKKTSHLYSSAPDLMNYDKEDDKKNENSSLQEDNENCMILNAREITETVMPPEKYEDSYISYDAIEHTKNEIIQGASTTLLFTTTEIKAIDNGIIGEVCVNAGVMCRLRISNENPPNKLYWTFSCDSERIPVSLHCVKEECLKFVICNNELEMEDHMELSLPGAYILQLDNSSSRVAQRLKYSLKINNDSAINIS